MGFDVLYLPPIHPIGRVQRKGKNNALVATPDDVGSPWAIGAAEGGHKDILPALGTPADFAKLVASAAAQGIELDSDPEALIDYAARPEVARILHESQPYTGWAGFVESANTHAEYAAQAELAARLGLRVNTLATRCLPSRVQRFSRLTRCS